MNIKKAKEAIKNLNQTLSKMKDKSLRYDNTIFQKPSISREQLEKIKKKIQIKFNLDGKTE